jgi:hypothetical protein
MSNNQVFSKNIKLLRGLITGIKKTKKEKIKMN